MKLQWERQEDGSYVTAHRWVSLVVAPGQPFGDADVLWCWWAHGGRSERGTEASRDEAMLAAEAAMENLTQRIRL